jgi:hypothetical protein
MTTSVRQETIAPLVTTFMDDPVIRWVYPKPGRYLECFAPLVEALVALLSDSVGATRVADVLAFLEQIDEHHPRTPTAWPMRRRPR